MPRDFDKRFFVNSSFLIMKLRRVHIVTAIALMLFALAPMNVWAGLDDYHVVTKLTGKVETRSFTRRRGRVSYGAWQRVRMGETIAPDCEVRVGNNASVWLQKGDQRDEPAKTPVDVKILYYVLTTNSVVRLNQQGVNGRPLVQALRGRVTTTTVRGRMPAPLHQ